MKIFIVILAFVALNAHAKSEAEVSLDSTNFRSHPTTIETSYEANSELGRAWVVLTLKDRDNGDSGMPDETIKVKVDGLSFDPATGNIVYENNQQKTICAVQKRFLTSRYYKKSKNCKINASLDTRKVDDGFSLKKEHVVNVILDSTVN